MKHLKLYESYVEDLKKMTDQMHSITFKVNEMRKKCENEIEELFKLYAIKDGKYMNLTVDIGEIYMLWEYTECLEKLYVTEKIGEHKIDYIVHNISDQLMVKIMDALVKKFPEYFEGKNMGFFDLKTTDKE